MKEVISCDVLPVAMFYDDCQHNQVRSASNRHWSSRVRGVRQLSWLKSLFAFVRISHCVSIFHLLHHYHMIIKSPILSALITLPHSSVHIWSTILHPGCNFAGRLHNDIRRHRGPTTMTWRVWNSMKINVNRGEEEQWQIKAAIYKLRKLGRCDSYTIEWLNK